MINLNKDNTLVVETINASDRNIVMHFVNNQLVSINFWQGEMTTKLLIAYLDSEDKNLYHFLYERFKMTDWWDNYGQFQYLYNSPDYYDILEWIDDRIMDYINVAMRIEELESEIEKLKGQL